MSNTKLLHGFRDYTDEWDTMDINTRYQKVKELFEFLIKEYSVFHNTKIILRHNKRIKRTLGRASKKGSYCLVEIGVHSLQYRSWEENQDTIRHELAHVKDFIERGFSAHDYIWQQSAIYLKAKPNRCSESPQMSKQQIKTAYKYTLICENCGVIGGNSRKFRGGKIHTKCRGKITQKQNY